MSGCGALLAVLAWGALAGAPAPEPDGSEWGARVLSAKQHAAEGRFNDAAAAARRAVEAAETTDGDRGVAKAMALGLLAQAQWRLGRKSEAGRTVSQLRGLRPESGPQQLELGRILRLQNEPARAEKALARAVELSPDDHEAYAELGLALAGQGRYREAAEAFERSLRIQPREHWVYARLADAYWELGLPDKARKTHQRAKAHGADSAWRYAVLGYSRQDSGDPETALKTFRMAQSLDPGDPEAYHHQASFHFMRGEYEQAEGLYRKALGLAEKASDEKGQAFTLTHLGHLLLACDRVTEALACFERAASLWERQKEADRWTWEWDHVHSATMRMWLLRGDHAEAEAHYRKAIKGIGGDPKHPRALSLDSTMAAIYEEQGRFEEARRLYELVVRQSELAERPSLSQSYTLGGLARVYLKLGRYSESEVAYERALALWKGYGNRQRMGAILRSNADLRRRQGRPDEARRLEERAAQEEGEPGPSPPPD